MFLCHVSHHEVDCTSDTGKPLCDQNGVRGFPTLKHGDPSALEDYKGGRDFDSFEKFATENLVPLCSPANIDLCDDERKATIAELQALSLSDLKAKIEDGKTKLKSLEEEFEVGVKGLQERYKELQNEKEEGIAAVKSSGMSWMQSVLNARTKNGESSEEL